MKAPAMLLAALLSLPPLTTLAQAETEAAITPPLGRLFMTPEKRQQLDRQRKYGIHGLANMDADTLKLNGVVRRSSGHNSVWINQQMQYGTQNDIHLPVGRADTVDIHMDKTAPVQLQVGDSVNRSTQERKELVPPNAVRPGKH